MKYIKLFENFKSYFESLESIENNSREENNLLNEFFNDNSSLTLIGTIEEYQKYLDTIFPSTKLPGIWQHISPHEFDFNKFGGGNFGKGYYFSKLGDDIYTPIKGKHIRNLAKLNVTSPRVGEAGEASKFIYKRLVDKHGAEIEFYPGDPEFTEVENEFIELNTKKGFDAIVGGKNGQLESEVCLYDKNKIYLLGSKQDIEGFRKYLMSKGNN